MPTLLQQFMADHQACDARFARLEAALAAGDADEASGGFAAFQAALVDHFAAEEEIMFPAFESRSGLRGGPTVVMRGEHEQMRSLCKLIEQAMAGGNFAQAAKLADTLFSLLQSHNMKEEQILYPMCDATLADDPTTVAAAVARLSATRAQP